MELLDLPYEILHLILVHAAAARGIKRAVRLRLVCKPFAQKMYPALFATRLMDDVLYPYRGLYRSTFFSSGFRQSPSDRSAANIWQKYLVYRSLHERDPTIGRFVEIRQIAGAICLEAELELQPTLEALCYLAVSHGAMTVAHHELRQWGPTTKAQKIEANLSVNMLTAAAHLNHIPLARRLLADGCKPAHHNYLFPPPLQVAAQAGNAAMLRLFHEKIPSSAYEPWSVNGAAMRGDLDIVKLALRQDNNDRICGQPYGLIAHDSEMGMAIMLARSYTSSPEVYRYLTGALTPWQETLQNSYHDLTIHAGLGNIKIVRHLLHLGVPVQMSVGSSHTPLTMACRGYYNDVADLLLEHGADPNFAASKFSANFPLHESAMAGNLSLVKKLVDRGALLDRPDGGPGRYPILFWAFAKENESMVKLLLDLGASFDIAPRPGQIHDGWLGRELAEMTFHFGYLSMAQILQEHGFSMPAPCTCRHKYRAKCWTSWEEARRVGMFGMFGMFD